MPGGHARFQLDIVKVPKKVGQMGQVPKVPKTETKQLKLNDKIIIQEGFNVSISESRTSEVGTL